MLDKNLDIDDCGGRGCGVMVTVKCPIVFATIICLFIFYYIYIVSPSILDQVLP